MEQLKPREQKIYDFMKKETTKKGYPPTVREICTALNIKSTSTVHKDVARLEIKGYIKKDPAKPRAISFSDRLKGKGSSNVDLTREDVLDIPVVGHIAAGTPITAEENIEAYFPVPAEYAKGDNFMLTVRGDSMIEAGIFDGDKILVRQQPNANNGEIVVAMLQGFESEATVKTYYKEDGKVRLQPENTAYSPIIVKDVQILGVVKGVFRYIN
ncbi:MAG: transcriptional repressor LexA [Clostridiales Family XIII bacterium]|jgi:repressor LexA|nr:transcriptional repressor LexA [Clostridiales Family XIII bacterium]